MPFQAILIEQESSGETLPGRRILQTDLDKYEAAFNITQNLPTIPENTVLTIDDLNTAGEQNDIRISTDDLQVGGQFVGNQ